MSYKKDVEIIKPFASELISNRERTEQNKILYEFSCLLDSLCKDGTIAEKTYNNCFLSLDGYYPYLICGSYKVRI